MFQQPYSEKSTMNEIIKSAQTIALPSKDQYETIITTHAKLHQGSKRNKRLDSNEDLNEAGDFSCSVCYPLDENSLTAEFLTFRDEKGKRL